MTDTVDTTITVRGTVAAGFEGVREEYAAVLAADHTEPGSQLAVYHRGRLVVDLWAGEGITGDSLPAVYSSTKGAAHLVVALLVQDGVIDLERTVASYWPEFAAEGKGELTVRELMSHRAGLIWVDGGFGVEELADDRVIAARLAGQRPYWTPGTEAGYHALTIGALTGEVVRRPPGGPSRRSTRSGSAPRTGWTSTWACPRSSNPVTRTSGPAWPPPSRPPRPRRTRSTWTA